MSCRRSASARDGLLSALTPRSRGGIAVEGRWDAAGMRGTVSHSLRYDAAIDESEVIGPPGGLLTIDLSGFALGSIFAISADAPQALGTAS